jgi:hypothetical protein
MDVFSLADIVNAVINVRRGTNDEREQVLFGAGELVYTTDKKRAFIGDGLSGVGTYGGNLIGNKVWYSADFVSLGSIEKYDLVYRSDLATFYVLTGDNKNLINNYIPVGGQALVTAAQNYTLNAATSAVLGGVIPRDGLEVNTNGNLGVKVDNSTIKILNNTLFVNVTGLGSIVPIATDTVAGIVSPTSGLLVDTSGNVAVNIDNSTIKLSSDGLLYVDQRNLSAWRVSNGSQYVSSGLITVGNGLSADVNGFLFLSPATDSAKGGVIIGNGLSGNGVGNVTLYPTSSTQFGGIKLGQALSSNSDGLVDVAIDYNTITIVGGVLKAAYNPAALAKLWVSFDGTGANGNISGQIRDAFPSNAITVIKNSTGVYSLSWPMSLSANGSNYVVISNASTPTLGTMVSVSLSSQNLTSCIVNCVHHTGSPSSTDSSIINVSIFSN